MWQTDGMAELVDTGQVDNRIAEEDISQRSRRQGFAKLSYLRHDEHHRSGLAIDLNALGFAE